MSVNNVSAVSDALKYINGMDVEEQQSSITEDLKSSIFSPVNLIFGGLEVSSSLKDVYGKESLKEALSAIKNGEEAIAGKSLVSTSFSEQLKQAYSNVETKVADKAVKAATKETGKTGLFSWISKGKDFIKQGISSAASAIGKSAPGTAIKEVLKKVGSKSIGSNTIGGIFKTISSKTGTLLKGTGAVGMMAIEGVLGFVTEVIPAFSQGGVTSGIKQIGKTAIKTVGTGLGWAGGSTVGAAIGATIGSIFPGVGTVVGGAIGKFVGGIAGSIIGGGIGKKIAGKSEVEKLQDKQFEEAAAQVAQDSSAMSELNQLVSAQVQSEIANGTADNDTEKMAAYLNDGAFVTSSYSTNVSNYSSTGQNNLTASGNTASATSATNTAYWSEMAEKINNGDTSIYDISDEKLESLFNSSSASSSSSSSSYSAEDDDRINYFAVG